MKTKLMMAVLFVTACFTLSSCGGGKKQQNAEETIAALSIDDVMAKAAELVDQKVVIEGVCTHTLAAMVPRRCFWWVAMTARPFV